MWKIRSLFMFNTGEEKIEKGKKKKKGSSRKTDRRTSKESFGVKRDLGDSSRACHAAML